MNKTLPILTALLTASAFVQATPQTLNVYTYDSFSADWSAGPKVKAAFEQQFPQCKLNYVSFDNNGTLFNRVRLEGKKIKADVVLGLDSYQIEDAQKLKNETITGTDYLFKHLDEKLYSSDISDTLLPFISDFYEDYMNFCYTVLVMLLELNLTGKSITWLKMISTRYSVNIKLTSINMKNASLKSREAFSYFQNFAFEAVTHCFRCFSHRKTSISALFNHKNDVLL